MSNITIYSADISRELTTNWRNTLTEYNGLQSLYRTQENELGKREMMRRFRVMPSNESGPPESHLYACHITAYLPTEGYMVPRVMSQSVDPRTGQPIQVAEWLSEMNSWKRPTLHWTINQCMQEHDKNRMDPTKRCFAIIEPIEALATEALGGLLEDFETLGSHQLTNRAVVLVPHTKAEEPEVRVLLERKINIVFYNNQVITLPQAINRWFEEQNAYLLSPLQPPGQHSFFHSVASKSDVYVSAIDVMGSLQLKCFPHDITPMRQMELLFPMYLTSQIDQSSFSQYVEEYSRVVETELLQNDEQRARWKQYLTRLTIMMNLNEQMNTVPLSEQEKVERCRQALLDHQTSCKRSIHSDS